MNWVRDISVVTTPTESRALFDEKEPILESFYSSKLGKKTAWGLSTIRRKLRVRGEEKADFNSSKENEDKDKE